MSRRSSSAVALVESAVRLNFSQFLICPENGKLHRESKYQDSGTGITS